MSTSFENEIASPIFLGWCSFAFSTEVGYLTIFVQICNAKSFYCTRRHKGVKIVDVYWGNGVSMILPWVIRGYGKMIESNDMTNVYGSFHLLNLMWFGFEPFFQLNNMELSYLDHLA
ncbi:hypothetical protein Ancab_029327 [Ancistrocladus abbreviatus]